MALLCSDRDAARGLIRDDFLYGHNRARYHKAVFRREGLLVRTSVQVADHGCDYRLPVVGRHMHDGAGGARELIQCRFRTAYIEAARSADIHRRYRASCRVLPRRGERHTYKAVERAAGACIMIVQEAADVAHRAVWKLKAGIAEGAHHRHEVCSGYVQSGAAGESVHRLVAQLDETAILRCQSDRQHLL